MKIKMKTWIENGELGLMLGKESGKCILNGFGNGYPEALCGPPSFSWYCQGQDGKQQKYRLHLEDRKGEMLWDSGWIISEQSDNVIYEGLSFQSDCDYIAQVVLEDDKGNQFESNKEYFSTGLNVELWYAKWMRPGHLGGQTPLVRKEFLVRKEIARARLYICGLGYQESYINGKKIGNDILSPTWTDYRKRVCYNAYDIQPYLCQGENVLGILLGTGWYGMTSDGGGEDKIFLAQISIEYKDGEKEWIYTQQNDGWKAYANGPLKSSSLYIGEVYDARAEITDWCIPEAQDLKPEEWEETLITEPPSGVLVPQNVEVIEVVAELMPLSIAEPEENVYVVDFGQNIAGVVEIEIEEIVGREVCIRYAEILDKKGMVSTENLRSAQAQDIYIANGKKAKYRPRFTYHGFRYVEITGMTGSLKDSQIKALVIRNAVKKAGTFAAESELINKIQHMCQWTENNNLHGVPTDCPQRDERLGWLNDLTPRAEEAIYNFQLHRFYTKYLQDIADEQGKDTGAITDTAPYVGYGNRPADPVSSSYLILGWLLYMHYGDKQVLERHYDGYAAWTNYLANATVNGIVNYSYYGDWAAPVSGTQQGSRGVGAISGITPGKLMSTGFLYYNAKLMSRIAEVLGKATDIQKWNLLSEKTKKALNDKYYHKQEGYYAKNSQASNTLMAWLDISPDKEKTVQAIVDDVYRQGIHLTTGNICTRYILEVLTENGYIDLAYAIVTQTTYPSWGYMVENGATTTWERWEHVDSGPMLEMASHDHPMNATVSAWFYRYLLGIQPVRPGFREFKLQPYIPKKLSGVKGTLDTIKGTIETSWRKETDEKLCITVSVPFNTKCKVITPEGWGVKMIENGNKPEPGDSIIWLEPGNYKLIYELMKEEKRL